MPTVGVIKPSTRPGRAEELVMMLPKEIELAHAGCRIARGTREELERSFADFEEKVAEMAALRVDLIHPAGVPFLLLGRDGERSLVSKWESQHGIPIFTNGVSQVNALKPSGRSASSWRTFPSGTSTHRSNDISPKRYFEGA